MKTKINFENSFDNALSQLNVFKVPMLARKKNSKFRLLNCMRLILCFNNLETLFKAWKLYEILL